MLFAVRRLLSYLETCNPTMLTSDATIFQMMSAFVHEVPGASIHTRVCGQNKCAIVSLVLYKNPTNVQLRQEKQETRQIC